MWYLRIKDLLLYLLNCIVNILKNVWYKKKHEVSKPFPYLKPQKRFHISLIGNIWVKLEIKFASTNRNENSSTKISEFDWFYRPLVFIYHITYQHLKEKRGMYFAFPSWCIFEWCGYIQALELHSSLAEHQSRVH